MFNQLIQPILDLLFPERCPGCGNFDSGMCRQCRAQLAVYTESIGVIPALDAVSVAYVYQGPLRHAIHQLKYRRRPRVARQLGELLIPFAFPHARAVDAILPVPMHAVRRAERGFNQAELIAAAVARGTSLVCMPDGLVRVRATGQQVKLNAHERQANMAGAFRWQPTTPPPSRILIIDDVLTTGATMSACGLALREAGCREIYGLALARSRLDFA